MAEDVVEMDLYRYGGVPHTVTVRSSCFST